MRTNRYTQEQLIYAVQTSNTIRQVLIQLKLAPQGGSYDTINRAIKRLNLSTSHFHRSTKGRSFGPKRPIQDYLENKFYIQSYKLKNRLLAESILERKCISCGLFEWLGMPVPLELDHIDGNKENNSLSNIRLLCPNCHAFTPTYRAKNRK